MTKSLLYVYLAQILLEETFESTSGCGCLGEELEEAIRKFIDDVDRLSFIQNEDRVTKMTQNERRVLVRLYNSVVDLLEDFPRNKSEHAYESYLNAEEALKIGKVLINQTEHLEQRTGDSVV